MAKTCKKPIDKGKEYSAFFTYLSKASDCLANDLVIVKLHAYGFSIESLNLINNYLTEHKCHIFVFQISSSFVS